ncbi:helix-turn-helix domain-containing protein [Aquisalimonas lutea]|uniref:helix-turn-helix domain-containing protein n=1 Tax=Aquisalimonas lutea TaxID=1327750 RepID=UPI0025B362F6|nr:helix-turn-helix domain-containing protein [Aquisalimonas lutea]MDN3519619.1 helix-turn-helix domain-containing protein [Aquisalimonas lutea]
MQEIAVLTTSQAAEYLSVSCRTLIRFRVQRKGPAWTYVGHQVRYRRKDLDAYLDANRHVPVREDRE